MKIDLEDCGSTTMVTYWQAGNRIDAISIEIPKQKDDGSKAKIFIYLMAKISKSYYSGVLKKSIKLSPQELVDIGCCQSIEDARLKFKETLKILQTWRIKLVGRPEALYPFAGYCDYGNEHVVYLNAYLPLWEELVDEALVVLPEYYFTLSHNAANLLRYIFHQAVNNTKAIKEKGRFTLNLKDVQDALVLPNIICEATGKYAVKDIIELTVECIEQMGYSAHGALTEILLTFF